MNQLVEIKGSAFTKDTLRLYLSFLGLSELPRSVSEMPPTMNLPLGLFGDIEDSILQTNADGLERAQEVFFDILTQQFKCSKVFQGGPDSTGNEHTLYKMLNSYFGRKPLLSWHTHPKGIWYFSTWDVASAKALQRKGYIHVVGSERGVVAMMQTDKTAKMPLSSQIIYDETITRLRQCRFIDMNNVETARIMEELGYGYYYWFPNGGVQKGIFNKTIPLSKPNYD